MYIAITFLLYRIWRLHTIHKWGEDLLHLFCRPVYPFDDHFSHPMWKVTDHRHDTCFDSSDKVSTNYSETKIQRVPRSSVSFITCPCFPGLHPYRCCQNHDFQWLELRGFHLFLGDHLLNRGIWWSVTWHKWAEPTYAVSIDWSDSYFWIDCMRPQMAAKT